MTSTSSRSRSAGDDPPERRGPSPQECMSSELGLGATDGGVVESHGACPAQARLSRARLCLRWERQADFAAARTLALRVFDSRPPRSWDGAASLIAGHDPRVVNGIPGSHTIDVGGARVGAGVGRAAAEVHEGEGGLGAVEAVGASGDQADLVVERFVTGVGDLRRTAARMPSRCLRIVLASQTNAGIRLWLALEQKRVSSWARATLPPAACGWLRFIARQGHRCAASCARP